MPSSVLVGGILISVRPTSGCSRSTAACSASSSAHPDLVLMDIHLPGIDGLEAGRRIQAANPKVAVLLLSTCDREEFAVRFPGSGTVAFISKAAFGPDGLLDVWAHVGVVD